MTKAFWNDVKDFLVSVDLMEASGVLGKNEMFRSYRETQRRRNFS